MFNLTPTLKSSLVASACVVALTSATYAASFNIPGGDLATALNRYTLQSGVAVFVSGEVVRGAQTRGVKGDLTADAALSRLLSGTGFSIQRDPSGAVAIVPGHSSSLVPDGSFQMAQAAPSARATVETVTVTSSKLGGGDVQSIPIAITALSQEQLTSRQIAGGPDLVKEVPNLTFSKTNFSGYNLEIRGIGTQAISVTTDPAVAVAFNDTPFIRNHFFEQEFYDLAQAEVLRGPQGTLYGRNATAGVVNITSAKPTDQFEAMASADIGNYKNRRFEGMLNIPFVSDKLDLRIAGEWTKRDGYSFNETTGQPIDGRDLWSTRVTLGWKPTSDIQTYFIWEHFQENDDRLRTSKQLCKTDPGPTTLVNADGVALAVPPSGNTTFDVNAANFSQGCLPDGLYDKGDPAHGDYGSFGVPNGYSLPFVSGIGWSGALNIGVDPYAATKQSTNLRNIQSAFEPNYRAKNDTLEYNAEWNVTPSLTFYSDTGYNRDFLYSTEDYNRFNTSPGIFLYGAQGATFPPEYEMPDPAFPADPSRFYPGYPNGFPGSAIICDPQLGCSDRLVVQDLSTETAWQASQEFRLASDFKGPFNFSVGGNYMHYETDEKYYVFSNSFTYFTVSQCGPELPQGDNLEHCAVNGKDYTTSNALNPGLLGPRYTDPNPLASINDQGHNYFLSNNPYVLNSYALFGESYYNITDDLKLTAGLRWTDDQKHFVNYPSELLSLGYGYPTSGTVDQSWKKFTGRAVANWSPKLSFTDQSTFYASFAHGYKAGGANPPGAVLLQYSGYGTKFPTHPLTFDPEYIDAYEVGTKNTLLDGGLTLNGDMFFYDYKGYQISQIVDRTSVNLNFNATVKGAELEASYEPIPGLRFSFAGGYEATDIGKNQSAIDLIDRTAGLPGWVVMKPWVGQASNCIFPEYVAAAILQEYTNGGEGNSGPNACGMAYSNGLDPITQVPYSNTTYPIGLPAKCSNEDPSICYPASSYPGYDPLAGTPGDPYVGQNTANGINYGPVPNNGQGFAKNVGGNELPNAPHFTASLTAEYSTPITEDWAATLHGDFYWQSQSWARVFNDDPYDRIHGYTNLNLALTFTDTSGWQVMGYVKNVFDTTAITGDFLNSDDSGLTTNIFLTDPRLFGVRVTKHFEAGSPSSGYGLDFFSDADNRRPQVWLQFGGNYTLLNAGSEKYVPPFESVIPDTLPNLVSFEKSPGASFDWDGKISIQPEDSDWVLKAGIRYGRSTKKETSHVSLPPETRTAVKIFRSAPCTAFPISSNGYHICKFAPYPEFEDTQVVENEQHTMIDFTLGKDVGLGMFGGNGSSTFGAGVRIAQFHSDGHGLFNSDPHYNFPVSVKYQSHDIYNSDTHEMRNFRGVGPEITWDASQSLIGDPENGEVTLDWGVNAAVLFGRQKTNIEDQTYHQHCTGGIVGATVHCVQVYAPAIKTVTYSRSRRVTVPNLGGYIGASVKYTNSKISLGYRADTFFDAMDGGQETAKDKNRGFYGPYLNVSLGLGG